ncbi:MAG: hypothetical protein Q9216_001861 [Gyalolechia sp. 2 TL-2023]
MDYDDQQRLSAVEQAEKKLYTALEDQNPATLNFESSIQGGLKGKKKPVEERKAVKSYLDFVKSSQRFYRGYIQQLASQFGGIQEIEAVARRFRSDGVVPEKVPQISPDLQHALLQSCHRTLIRLGDLSRYRESEIDAKKNKKNWGPALGYYDLAIAIYPQSGIPYNQLAIISKNEGDHARALYHLYRAQSALEPPPTAFANLELEFKKIRDAWKRDHSISDDRNDNRNPLSKLQHFFPLLHSRCFDGIDIGDYEKLERDVLQKFSAGLKDRTLETNFVNRMALSNIAADFAAGDRWQDAPDTIQHELAFKLFQRLNLRTFTTLLHLLQAEYKDRSIEGSTDNVDVIGPIMRRLLPSLRYYQSWLLCRAALLSAHLGEPKMLSLIQIFWTTYAEVLRLMSLTTRFADLPRHEYLLEEDEEIIGFRPLQEGALQQKHLIPNSMSRKPKCNEQGVKRHHPNTEMLCRIRDFVEDAIELAHSEFVPIDFAHDAGSFSLKAPFSGENQSTSTTAHETNIPQPEDTVPLDAESTTDDAVSQGASLPLSHSATMNQMVDDLVGPNRVVEADPFPSHRPPTSTLASALENGANETSYGVGHSTLTALDFVNRVRSWSPKSPTQDAPNPTLPSIMNSPFAPRPEEEPVLTRSPAGKRKTPTHSPQLSQQHIPKYSLDSTVSSMSDPTLPSLTPHLHRLHPSAKNQISRKPQHQSANMGNFDFDSSNVVVGSSFPYDTRDRAIQPTPPNGQG